MAIFKISTLDNVSSLNDSDKLLVSKDVGGRYSYRNIDFDDLKIQVSSGFQDDIQAVRDDLGLSVGNLQQDILSASDSAVTVANAYTDGVISDYTTTETLQSTYLTKTDAGTTYATKTELGIVDDKLSNYTTTNVLSSTYMTKKEMTTFKGQLKNALKDTLSALSGNVTDGYNVDLNHVILCLNNIYNIVK